MYGGPECFSSARTNKSLGLLKATKGGLGTASLSLMREVWVSVSSECWHFG